MALWTCLILGAVIAYLGFKESYKPAAITGAVAFAAPWVLGFSRVTGALWSCLLLGGATALIGFFAKAAHRPPAH